MKIIPTGQSLVVMVGPSGAGKTTWVSEHFTPREVVSTDYIRWEFTGSVIRDDKDPEVIAEFHRRIEAKLKAGQRVVADATHIRNRDRRATAEVGFMMNVPVFYVIVDRPPEDKLRTGGWRLNVFKKGVGLIEHNTLTFEANEETILLGDHIRTVKVIDTRVDEYRVAQALPMDPHIIVPYLQSEGYEGIRAIGDIHGNLDAMSKTLHEAKKAKLFPLFMGDIVDYDHRGIEAVELLYDLIMKGEAISLRGNHEKKIHRWITTELLGEGFEGQLTHGNDVTISRIKAMDKETRDIWVNKFLTMVEMSPDWIQVGDDWMFTHGAVTAHMWDNPQFRANKDSKDEAFAMYGETTGEHKDGKPVRAYNWVDKLPAGKSAVVGHAVLSTDDPVTKRGEESQRAVFLDTGSSKTVDGAEGHLSWMDFGFFQGRKILPQGFGRE